jgi:hypothetical protein
VTTNPQGGSVPAALRSLDAGGAHGILPALAANAGSWGMNNPSRTLVQQERHKREHQVCDV